ncbi:hypothetical protein [Cohnella sp. GCM10027633]|uniref:hypothetical protein n=1 Tax=unclassified Cohnella TaxID=2636738 RepID=UPI00362691BE
MNDSTSSFAYSVLSKLLKHYHDHGIPAKLADPDEAAPYASLLIRFEEIGSQDDSLLLEMSFVPGLEEAAHEGVYLLQSFAVLRDRTPPEKQDALLRACASLNLTLPVGAFGVLEEGGALFFKHNAMVRGDWLQDEEGVRHLDRVNGLILHQLHQFMDRLLVEVQ